MMQIYLRCGSFIYPFGYNDIAAYLRRQQSLNRELMCAGKFIRYMLTFHINMCIIYI